MGTLLAFAPFILFAVIELRFGVKAGLLSATTGAIVLLTRNALNRTKSVKVLEVGSAVLFTVIASYVILSNKALPIAGVRLCVDAGLLLVVLVSIVIRHPFTLQYAREQIAPEFWNRPGFVHANYIITAVWALAFALMVTSDLTLLVLPRLPVFFGMIATGAAMAGAALFTSWYPGWLRHKQEAK